MYMYKYKFIYTLLLRNYVSALFTFHPELFVERAFDPYSSRPDHRLDSNARLGGNQGRPLDGALTTKSDFTGVTLTTRIQDCCMSASL